MPFYLRQNQVFKNNIYYKNHFINQSIIPNHINNSTTNRLNNKNPSTDMAVYSYQDPYFNGIGQFTRNPSCWINGVDNISCFSPAQLSGSSWFTRAGTLITKKHILLAKHYTISILNGGTPIIFVDENNNVIRRNIVNYGFGYTDIAVAVLDEEVPSNIKIAKVLPKYYQDYIGYPTNILAISLDQQEKAILKILTGLQTYQISENNENISVQNVLLYSISSSSNPYQNYANFSENIVVGDSGNPVFLLIDNELVVITTWWTTIGGPFITNQYDKINQVIENLSPGQGYSLTPINLDLVYHKYSF